jgi:hypothetical protein
MNMMPSPDLTYLLFLANEAEIGISVVTNNPELLRNKLYAERKRQGLTNLTFIQPPVDSDTRLWIVKKEAKANAET